ncbi:MAG: U32 family peptidase [Acutalibacteraceae bacterium]|nr:U32 family peptidase [Acutalibacteraceae bacterium]
MSILIKDSLPELLCPAGDLIRLKTAVDFGADAVYLAGQEFGMRTASSNFSLEDLKEGVDYAHKNGVSVHITCNTLPHEDELARLPDFLSYVDSIGADAIISGDLGTINLVKKYAPHCQLHASVQSGIVNSETAKALYNMGAKRVVLARELSLAEIESIRKNTPDDLELECFIHGAMCVSYSGRCLLSSYMTGRDANRGDCAQPCRWSYNLMEETREGQLFNITETEKGTYILNANDLCMAEHLKKLSDIGVSSFKIEGRAKTEYYVAVTTNAYRGIVDSLLDSDENWSAPAWAIDELNKISHRTYSTGFYFGRPQNAQTYENAGYMRDYAIAAIVTGYEDGCVTAILKNKFLKGTALDCLEAGSVPFTVETDNLFDENGMSIDTANRPMMTVKIPFEREIKTGSMLRMKV